MQSNDSLSAPPLHQACLRRRGCGRDRRPAVAPGSGGGSAAPGRDRRHRRGAGHKEDATKVDAAKYAAQGRADLRQLQKFFSGTAAYGPCQLFPGKAVNAKGWCSAYAAKA